MPKEKVHCAEEYDAGDDFLAVLEEHVQGSLLVELYFDFHGLLPCGRGAGRPGGWRG